MADIYQRPDTNFKKNLANYLRTKPRPCIPKQMFHPLGHGGGTNISISNSKIIMHNIEIQNNYKMFNNRIVIYNLLTTLVCLLFYNCIVTKI